MPETFSTEKLSSLSSCCNVGGFDSVGFCFFICFNFCFGLPGYHTTDITLSHFPCLSFFLLPTVLVLVRIELIFLLVAGMVLCLGFMMRVTLLTVLVAAEQCLH